MREEGKIISVKKMKEKNPPQEVDKKHLGSSQDELSEVKVVNVKNVDNKEVDVYIGRGNGGDAHLNNTEVGDEGWLGNPYTLQEDGDRKEVIQKFTRDFFERLLEDEEFYEAVMDLQGKTLGCFCKPKQCHGDVIADYVRSQSTKEEGRRVGIVGSRRREDKEKVIELVDSLKENDVVISGGCEGVDTWAAERARERGLDVVVHLPDLGDGDLPYYETCKRYYARNREIVKDSDIIHAFVAEDRTGGTENTIKHAKELEVEVVIQ